MTEMTAMTGMGLTRRQAECLAAIRSYVAAHGCSPSYSDLCRALDLRSKSDIHWLLLKLQERGYVQWTPRQGRSLRLTAPCTGAAHPPPRACAGEGDHPQASLRSLRELGCMDGGGGVTLPPALAARLAAHCAETGDDPAAVIADAVLLHLDAVESNTVDDAEALAMFGAAFDGVTP